MIPFRGIWRENYNWVKLHLLQQTETQAMKIWGRKSRSIILRDLIGRRKIWALSEVKLLIQMISWIKLSCLDSDRVLTLQLRSFLVVIMLTLVIFYLL